MRLVRQSLKLPYKGRSQRIGKSERLPGSDFIAVTRSAMRSGSFALVDSFQSILDVVAAVCVSECDLRYLFRFSQSLAIAKLLLWLGTNAALHLRFVETNHRPKDNMEE